VALVPPVFKALPSCDLGRRPYGAHSGPRL